MSASYYYPYRGRPYQRSRYRRRYRRGSSRMAGFGLVVVAFAAFTVAGKAATPPAAPHAHKHKAAPAPAQVVTVVTGTGETAFWKAVLADLGVPPSKRSAADLSSLSAWGSHEGCWGCVGRWNQLDSTLYTPGATAFNTFYSNGVALHVWNYLDATTGARETAATIAAYPLITAALQSGAGLHDNPSLAGEFYRWSGGGYSGV